MQTVTMASSKRTVLFQRQEKKPSRRSRKARSEVRISEALAKCQAYQDIVAGICEAAGVPASYVTIEAIWPWLKNRVEVPCGCRIVHPSVLVTLCHLYDRHVRDLKDWSLSELVEWVTGKQAKMEGNQESEAMADCPGKAK